MALMNCPDCQKEVSDQAQDCKYCGYPIARYVQERKDNETKRLADELAARDVQVNAGPSPQSIIIGLVVVGFIVAFVINANANPAPKQYYNNSWNQSATPGGYTIQANGKVKVTYSCSLNSGKTATADLSLVDLKSSKVVWSKQVKCVSGNYEKPLSEFTDTVQLKASNYDIGTKITGDGTWSVTITQA